MIDNAELRVVFAGTPAFAVPSLRALQDIGVTVTAVLTQPDRPSGRGRKLVASPIKALALEQNLPVFQPHRIDADAHAFLTAHNADLMLVVAYGLLLPETALQIPSRGCLNVHASLLPRWRGAAPIARAIEAGDDQTGVCLMQMTAGLDQGPVWTKAATKISPTDTAASLHDRLADLGADLLRQHLLAIVAGDITAVEQNEIDASYAKKLTKSEAVVDWHQDATLIERRIRAFNPWPMATTHHGTTPIKIWAGELLPVQPDRHTAASGTVASGTVASGTVAPGTVIAITKDHIRVACVNGDLAVTCLQRPGGKALASGQFLRGYAIQAGERFT